MYQFTEDKNEHARRFANTLLMIVAGMMQARTDKDTQKKLTDMSQHFGYEIQRHYNTNVVKMMWDGVIGEIENEGPIKDSK